MKLSEWVPVLFLAFVFLLGGGARSDIASLPILRGMSVLFAFWAALRLRGEDWKRIRVPLTLLLLLALWMALQLVPLPASIWHGLPGRDTIVAIDRLTGQAELWRPLSLTPSQTLNALLAMTVPIAALLVAAQMTSEEYPRLLMTVVALACASMLLGLLQILSGPASPAYLYRIANTDSMIGLFSNRNHHAIFLACVIPLVAFALRDELMRKRKRPMVGIGLALAGIMLTVMTIMIGSRGGLLAGVISFVIGYAIVAGSWGTADLSSGRGLSRYRRWFLYAPPALMVLFVGLSLFLSSRTTALTRFMDQSVGDDLRVSAWPTVRSMIETYWVAGSGFGSFPGVYKMFEPDRLLQGAYFNHAHNDWAEAIMTGGLPFALIVGCALVWFGVTVSRRGTRNLIKGHRGDFRLPILTIVLILATTSLADYPLRVPSLQSLAIILVLFLCCPKLAGTRRDGLQ
ncbi:O-antigen ligase family protein [Sphingopyxis sp.]|uniref:O-antigen ligase family protein n=1 Tax=Sphingopyxis sp. TaxID=1908224 RepID=UPI0035AEBF45